MKKLLLASLLSLGLLFPTSISASTNNTTSTTEFSTKKPKKSKGKTKKNRKSKRSKARSSRSSRSYSKSRGCTYNGHPLNVGPRGGCYYYSGNSKEYVDRSYCSGCN